MQAELYEITPCPHGRLAIMPRPRGGAWLKTELESLARRGVTDVVSLLTPPEENQLELQAEPEVCAGVGLRFHHHPILDGNIPQQPFFDNFIASLLPILHAGGYIAVHCRAGIGRAAVTSAALLCGLGVNPGYALELITRARGYEVPDTDVQHDFIMSLDPRQHPLG
jgi:protein-tyrosine phosphatase